MEAITRAELQSCFVPLVLVLKAVIVAFTAATYLPCVERSLKEKDNDQDNGQRKVSLRGRVSKRSPGDKHQYASNQKDRPKTTEEVAHDLREAARWRFCHLVLAMFSEATRDLL